MQKACESGCRVSLDHHFRALFECFSRDSISRRKICKKEGQDSYSRVFNFRDLFTIAKNAKWRTCETPLCNRPSGIYILTGFSKKTSLGWLIFQWVFLTWVLPIKPHLYRYENWRRTKRFTLFYASLITCTLPIFFLSMIIMLCIICFSWTIMNNADTGLVKVLIESDRVRKKSAGQKETFHRVSGRLNTWVGFHWVCYRGLSIRSIEGIEMYTKPAFPTDGNSFTIYARAPIPCLSSLIPGEEIVG